MWDIVKEIFEVLANVGAVGGLIFTGIQLLQVKKQLKETQKQSEQMNEQLQQIKLSREKQYEHARREKTSDMVRYYTERVNPQTKYIEKIVANFDDDQCVDLYNCTPFAVEEEVHKKLCSICPNKDKCEDSKPSCKGDDNKFYVKDELLYCLRGNIVNYLNTLESVLLTWELGIVEQSVIVEQFAFLDKKGKRNVRWRYFVQ